jgi:YVTN family beta-propeller protein
LELKVFLAGRIVVEGDGVLIDEERLPGRQGRLLFAYLVAEQGRPVPRDELAEALWGEAPPATWEKSLSVVVSKLRALLVERGVDGSNVLTSAFGCYRLNLPEGTWVDVVAAADVAREAEAALAADDLESAKALATRAASLARRPFLPGEEGAWVDGKRRELADVLRHALVTLSEACLRSGDDAEAAKSAEELIVLEPYRETGYRRLMEAHAAAGNRAEALRVYERCRRLLSEELGAYPSPETEAIYRQLLEAPAVQAVAAAAPVAPLPDAAPVADLEPEPGSTLPRRLAFRWRVGVAAVTVAATAAVVAGFLATRGGETPATAVEANAVGLIDAEGDRVRDQVAVDAAPTSVAFGHDAVWVTNAFADTVTRIDPESRSVRDTITVGNSPSGIAVGGGGVWVANHDDGTVSWINPQSNTEVRRIGVGHGPTAVAYGFGSVWVTNSDDRTVSRIDAVTGDVVARIPSGAVGRGIAVGPGSVWVTDEATGTVVRIDPAKNQVRNKNPVGGGPADIVYGDGAVWVANEFDGTVSEVDPTTLAVRAAIPVGGSPSALAFGAGGLWVGVEFGQRVVRIDTRTGRESATLRVGNRPKGLTAVPDGVWVAVQASGTGHRGGRLIVIDDLQESVDPGVGGAFRELGLAYDGLTAFRRVGGSHGTQLVADLAAALPMPTDGGRSYTFRIRAGIRYSDGSPLRAQDFRRALERILVLGSPYFGDTPLTKIVGASRCSSGRPCDLSRGVIVNGPNSLTLRLSAPDPRLLEFLTDLVPVPAGTPPEDVGTKPVPSTGPYEIESYVPHKLLRFVRNSHFRSWSHAARPDGYPDEIVWRSDVKPDQAVRQVVEGKADLTQVPAKRVEELAARYPRRLHLVPQRATAFVFLNTRRAPFGDMRVRQALNYAVDRKRMVALHGGPAVAQPTCQAVPPTVPGYRRYCPYTADPDSSGQWKAPDLAKARRLIAASGTKGERIVVWTFPFLGKEGRYFVSLLRRLGYRAQLKELRDLGTYFATLNRTPSAQAGFAGWFGVNLAADVFETLNCRHAANWAHFCDPRLDGDVTRLAAEQANDPAAGAALAARLDRELVDRAPWVPLFTPRIAEFASKRVGNYQPNSYTGGLLDQIWVR